MAILLILIGLPFAALGYFKSLKVAVAAIGALGLYAAFLVVRLAEQPAKEWGEEAAPFLIGWLIGVAVAAFVAGRVLGWARERRAWKPSEGKSE